MPNSVDNAIYLVVGHAMKMLLMRTIGLCFRAHNAYITITRPCDIQRFLKL